jgi:ribosomal protein S27AE
MASQTKIEKMICPKCGAEMNHHADKVILGDAAAGDRSEFGGVVEELHRCPACGTGATRPEAA